MTKAQEIFCNEYLIDTNGTRAYKVAYPKVKKDSTARANASRLLAKANIMSFIDELMKKKNDELIAKQDEVLKHLTSVLRGESESEVVVVEGDGDGYSSARCIKKKPDEKEKLKAAELLGKRYGLFVEKKELNGSINSEIKVTLTDD